MWIPREIIERTWIQKIAASAVLSKFYNVLGEEKFSAVLYVTGRDWGLKLFKENFLSPNNLSEWKIPIPTNGYEIMNLVAAFLRSTFPKAEISIETIDTRKISIIIGKSPLRPLLRTPHAICYHVAGLLEFIFSQILAKTGVKANVKVDLEYVAEVGGEPKATKFIVEIENPSKEISLETKPPHAARSPFATSYKLKKIMLFDEAVFLLNSFLEKTKNILGEEKSYELLYLAGRSEGKRTFKIFSEKYDREKIKPFDNWRNADEFLESLLRYRFAPNSIPASYRVNDKTFVLKLLMNPFTQGVKTKKPFCGFLKGALESMVSLTVAKYGIGKGVSVEEIKCKASGDDHCEFQVTLL